MPAKTLKRITRQRSEKLLPPSSTYRAKVDSKHRIVLRSAQYEYYTIYEREDGSMLAIPQIMTDVPLSNDTLKMIDSAVKNMKRNIVSKPIGLEAFLPKKKKK